MMMISEAESLYPRKAQPSTPRRQHSRSCSRPRRQSLSGSSSLNHSSHHAESETVATSARAKVVSSVESTSTFLSPHPERPKPAIQSTPAKSRKITSATASESSSGISGNSGHGSSVSAPNTSTSPRRCSSPKRSSRSTSSPKKLRAPPSDPLATPRSTHSPRKLRTPPSDPLATPRSSSPRKIRAPSSESFVTPRSSSPRKVRTPASESFVTPRTTSNKAATAPMTNGLATLSEGNSTPMTPNTFDAFATPRKIVTPSKSIPSSSEHSETSTPSNSSVPPRPKKRETPPTSVSSSSTFSDHSSKKRPLPTTSSSTAVDSLPPPALAGAMLFIEILQGRELVAKARNMLGKRISSDPYAKVHLFDGGGEWPCHGKTAVIPRTLAPVWNETVIVSLGADAAHALLKSGEEMELRLFDHDPLAKHDYMGSVTIPLFDTTSGCALRNSTTSSSAPPPLKAAQWYRVKTNSPNDPNLACPNASGAVQARVTVHAEAMLDLRPGDVFTLPFLSSAGSKNNNQVTVGMAWDATDASNTMQVELYCVAMDAQGHVVLDESLYWDQWNNANRSMVHSGTTTTTGNRTGEQSYRHVDNQMIHLQLDRLPGHIMALFFVVAIQGPADKSMKDLKRFQMRYLATETQKGLCRYVPSKLSSEHTAFISCRLARDATSSSSWNVAPLGIGCSGARDFGPLLPHLMACMGDLLPGIQVHAKGDRIAFMRPERSIRVSDYVRRSRGLPKELIFRTTLWRKKNMISLDVAAIVLDKEYRKIDCVCKEQVQTRDQSIQYKSESSSNMVGPIMSSAIKSPSIALNLPQVSKMAQYICFVIIDNEEGRVKKTKNMRACFSLEEGKPEDEASQENLPVVAPVAQASVSYSREKARVLLLACLYRGGVYKDDDDNINEHPEDEWNLSILGRSVQGKSIADQGNALRWFLQANPPPPPALVQSKLAKRVSRSAAILDNLLPIQPNLGFIAPEQLSKYL